MSIFSNYFNQKWDQRYASAYSALVHHEARVGGELFGPIPAGHRREFFALDERTFVWHEEWKDEADQWQTLTTRYDARPGGVLKSQGSNSYQRLDPIELFNLYEAIKLYGERVGEEQRRMLQVV